MFDQVLVFCGLPATGKSTAINLLTRLAEGKGMASEVLSHAEVLGAFKSAYDGQGKDEAVLWHAAGLWARAKVKHILIRIPQPRVCECLK